MHLSEHNWRWMFYPVNIYKHITTYNLSFCCTISRKLMRMIYDNMKFLTNRKQWWMIFSFMHHELWKIRIDIILLHFFRVISSEAILMLILNQCVEEYKFIMTCITRTIPNVLFIFSLHEYVTKIKETLQMNCLHVYFELINLSALFPFCTLSMPFINIEFIRV